MDAADRLLDTSWAQQQPPVLVPVPAADVHLLTGQPLTGQRLVVHVPERGVWRYDLRAATEQHPYRLPSGEVVTCVGVLEEAEWYRQQREGGTPAVPTPMPLDWLWVEQPIPAAEVQPDIPDQSRVPDSLGNAEHLVGTADKPPVRWPRPALHERGVIPGARAIYMGRGGPEMGLRVCGAPRLVEFQAVNMTSLETLDQAPEGPVVPMCTEDKWYAWAQTGRAPAAVPYWLVPVWLE